MKIIKTAPNASGSYPALQDWKSKTLPEGYAWCSEEFETIFYSTSPAGFVDIVVTDDAVTEMTINQAALDEYIANNPDQPEEESGGTSIYDELATAFTEGVNSIDE